MKYVKNKYNCRFLKSKWKWTLAVLLIITFVEQDFGSRYTNRVFDFFLKTLAPQKSLSTTSLNTKMFLESLIL